MRCAWLVLLTSGCSTDPLFLDRPWEADRTVVLIAVDDGSTPIGSPSIASGGTVELDIDAEPPFSVYAYVFAPEVLAPSCDIELGKKVFPLPAEREIWKARIEERHDSPGFAIADAPALDLKTSCDLPKPCPNYQLEEELELDELYAGHVAGLLAISDSRVLFSSGANHRIFELDGDQRRMLDTSAIEGAMRTLELDGNTVYGATSREAFRFALGEEIFEVVETTTTVKGLELVPGGPPIVYGDSGIQEVFTDSLSATTAIERVNTMVRQVSMATHDLGMLVDEESGIAIFRGEGWSGDQPGVGGLTVESFRVVDGDARSFMTVGRRENAFIFADNRWTQLPPPFNRGVGLNDVESLGDDRFFICGEFGTVALYQNDGWCTYDLGTQLTLERIEAAPGERTIWVGSQHDAAQVPHLFKLTLR